MIDSGLEIRVLDLSSWNLLCCVVQIDKSVLSQILDISTNDQRPPDIPDSNPLDPLEVKSK